MLDFPQEHFQQISIETEHFLADRTLNNRRGFFIPVSKGIGQDIEQDLDLFYLKAKGFVSELGGYFEWKDLCSIIQKSFQYVKQTGAPTIEEEAKQVLTILNHAMSVTKKEFLTFYSDPLFKTIAPVFVSLVSDIVNNVLKITPMNCTGTPTEQDFEKFKTTLKQTLSTFQWSDVPACLVKTVEFIEGFSSLSTAQKEQDVITILEGTLDLTTIPYIPNTISSAIFNELIPPFVSLVFNALAAKTTKATTTTRR